MESHSLPDGGETELVQQLRDCNEEEKLAVLHSIYAIAVDGSDNRLALVSNNRLVVAEVIEVVRGDRGEARLVALKILQNLAVAKLITTDIGLLDALVQVIREDRGQSRLMALSTIWELSYFNASHHIIVDSRVDLLGLLVQIVKQIHDDDDKMLIPSLAILANVAVEKKNQYIMADQSLGLMALLVEKLREYNKEARNCTLRAIWGLSISLSNVKKFLEFNLEVVLNDILRQTTVDVDLDQLLSTILVYCRYRDAAKAFRRLPGAEQMVSLIAERTGPIGLKAVLILSMLAGRDENNRGSASLLESRPERLLQLVDVLDNNIKKQDGVGYHFGDFDLNAVTSAIHSLCISDANKTLMVESPMLLQLLVQLLQAYVTNEPEYLVYVDGGACGVGGGGDDKETAEYILESLLQLSLHYDSDEALVRDYMIESLHLSELLEDVLSLSVERKLSDDATLAANNLLKRLKYRSSTTVATSSDSRRHIMLSYAWAAKKQLVIKLQQALRTIGYDVWRDEDGSSIVPAMSGGVYDRIAEAIENSYVVIICVSPQYKESGNCQLEGKYCNKLQMRGRLKIIYLMMYEDYTTNSNICVDGWLGLQVNVALWYPLWAESELDSTVSALGRVIGDYSQIRNVSTTTNGTTNSVLAQIGDGLLSTAPTFSSASTERSLESAWKLLTDYFSSTDADRPNLIQKIHNLGLSEPADLGFLEDSEVQELVALMKQVKGRRFVAYIEDAKRARRQRIA